MTEKWYFTFGQGHYTPSGLWLGQKVVEIEGSYEEARRKLVEVVGDKWAFQYESKEAAGVHVWLYAVTKLEWLKELWES